MTKKTTPPPITLELDQETYDAIQKIAERDEISVEDCAYNLLLEGLSLETDEEWGEDEDSEEDEDDGSEHRDPWGKGL